MRICLSPGTIGGGGIGVVTLNLAAEFVSRGHDVDLLLLAEETGRTIPDGVNPVLLGSRTRHGLSSAIRYLRGHAPDLVVSSRDHINLLMMAAHRLAGGRSRSRLIWTFHTHHGAQISGVPRIADRIAHHASRWVAPFADGLVAVSRGVAHETESAFRLPAGTVDVIENPVWTPLREAASRADSPHAWFGTPQPTIVAIGRLVGQKDFPTLLSAFARVRTHMPARLIILGEGEDRHALTTRIRQLEVEGVIDMPGHVDNPLAYLSHADLFVLSSRWEGFPLSLVEALGCGCPVVATDCPSGPDEILDGGRLGRLTPVGQADALADAMLATLRDPGDPAPRKLAALRFTAARAADFYLKVAGLG